MELEAFIVYRTETVHHYFLGVTLITLPVAVFQIVTKLCCRRGRAMLRVCSSFNSTKRRAHSLIVSYVGYRFIDAYN